MDKGDIRIKNAIVHIMDSAVGMPVLSDSALSPGSDMADFLAEHIYKTLASDDIKKCRFIEEESEVFKIIKDYKDGAHGVYTCVKVHRRAFVWNNEFQYRYSGRRPFYYRV